MVIREATESDIPGIARAHVDSWRSAYRGIVPNQVLDCLSYVNRERLWTSILAERRVTGHTCVADRGDGTIVGFVDAGSERGGQSATSGEIYAIYLIEAYQRQGIGKQLFFEAGRRLSSDGCKSLMLWVLAANPSCRFYRAMGGNPTQRKTIMLGGEALVEVAYTWGRIGSLFV